MGYCENCKKCGRLYDTKYFTEFCPWCYVGYDELLTLLKIALPNIPGSIITRRIRKILKENSREGTEK